MFQVDVFWLEVLGSRLGIPDSSFEGESRLEEVEGYRVQVGCCVGCSRFQVGGVWKFYVGVFRVPV
jgi:hypothetical protein